MGKETRNTKITSLSLSHSHIQYLDCVAGQMSAKCDPDKPGTRSRAARLLIEKGFEQFQREQGELDDFSANSAVGQVGSYTVRDEQGRVLPECAQDNSESRAKACDGRQT